MQILHELTHHLANGIDNATYMLEGCRVVVRYSHFPSPGDQSNVSLCL